jgi:hypothetical protein
MEVKKLLTTLFLIGIILKANAQTDLEAKCDSLRHCAQIEAVTMKISFNLYLDRISACTDDSLAICVQKLSERFPFMELRITSVRDLKSLIKSSDKRTYYVTFLYDSINLYYKQRIMALQTFGMY